MKRGDALAALEIQPHRKQVAEKRPEAGRNGRVRSAEWAAPDTATVPLRASQTSVAPARSRRPVRSTLVAPMLPEPISRISRRPASRVMSNPNGTDPRA